MVRRATLGPDVRLIGATALVSADLSSKDYRPLVGSWSCLLSPVGSRFNRVTGHGSRGRGQEKPEVSPAGMAWRQRSDNWR